MARVSKQSQLFIVRNEDGKRIGAVYAYTAKEAIAQMVREFAAQVTRSQAMPLGMDRLTASVED